MKAIIVLVVGVLLLVGAAMGGWLLYFKLMAKPPESSEPAPPPPKPPSAIVRVPSVVVPVIGENRVRQFVTVVVALEVDLEMQPTTQANLPRLSDAFLTTLYGAVDDRTIFRGQLVDLPALKAKLAEAATKVLGGHGVQDVLVQIVMQRNL